MATVGQCRKSSQAIYWTVRRILHRKPVCSRPGERPVASAPIVMGRDLRTGRRGQADDSGDYAYHCEKQDYDSDDAVDKPHRAQIEMGANLVDEESDHPPPHHGSSEYESESDDIMVVTDLRHQEVEAGEKPYHQKQYQRVGECEQEAAENGLPLRFPHGLYRFLQIPRRVFLEQIDAEPYKHDTSHKLDYLLVLLQKLLDERQSEACQDAIEKVGQGRPDTGVETRAAPLVEGALYTQDSHRPHRSRHYDAYGDSSPHHIEYAF